MSDKKRKKQDACGSVFTRYGAPRDCRTVDPPRVKRPTSLDMFRTFKALSAFVSFGTYDFTYVGLRFCIKRSLLVE